MSEDPTHDGAARPSFRRPLVRRGRPIVQGARALVAHQDAKSRLRIAVALRRDGFTVRTFRTGTQVIDCLDERVLCDGRLPDLIVADSDLPDLSGENLVRHLSTRIWVVSILLSKGGAKTGQAGSGDHTVFVFSEAYEVDDIRTAAVLLVRRRRPRR